MGLRDFFQNVIERQSIRKFYAPINADNILDGDVQIRVFKKDAGYFEFRLSEMYLRNSGELLRDFLPMTVIISEFEYDGAPRIVPFVVNSENLEKAIKAPIKNEYVELRNTKVAGPIPYVGGDVGLFVGLFRTEVNDLAKNLFGVVDKLARAFDVTQLSSYLPVGEVLHETLRDLFGMRAVELCLGARDEFIGREGMATRFQSGYFAFINTPENQLDRRKLWVREGRMYIGDERDSITRYADTDYCLVAIDHLDHRDDLARLPFHSLWEETQEMIWNEQINKADLFGFPALCKAVIQSPDLIPEDKSAALQLYKANFEREVERFVNLTQPHKGDVRKRRGSRIGQMGATTMMQKAAHIAQKSKMGDDTVASLSMLAKNYGSIPGLGVETERINLKEKMSEQLGSLRRMETRPLPDPEKLVEALALDTIDTISSSQAR